jgi:hypothetical protein
VSTEKLIPLLEEIRDQQKQQIANYERALSVQDEAMELQRRGRRTLLALMILPWVLVLCLLIIIFLEPTVVFAGLY